MGISFELANKYRKKGFSVFPVIIVEGQDGKFQKKPAVQWREYINRLPTEEELHGWFDSGNYNGIGLATGEVSGVVVIDVEADADQETVEFFKKSPFASRTISGGWHFYFQCTDNLRNTVRIDDKLVDFRGDGGFVVLPPSGIGNNTYKWQKTSGNINEIPPLPPEIKKLLVERHADHKPVFNFDEDEYPYPDVYEGGRNNAASQVIGSILARIPRNQWPVMGWATAKDWNDHHVHPPMEDHELKTVWDSIAGAEARNNPNGRDNLEESDLQSNYLIYSGKEALEAYKQMEKKFGDGITTGYPELDNYFKFLPTQLYLISAPTFQGKTTFALNLAGRIASFGYNVLFASLEQGIFIAPRVETILGDGKNKGEYPESLNLLVSDEMASVTGIINKINMLERKPDLIMIDHLHFMKKEKAKGNTEAIDKMIIDIQTMAKKLNLPVVVIGHIRKLNDDRSPELDDLRDSSYLQQVPWVILLLHRKKSENMEFGSNYLENVGSLFIAKNRVRGKTGMLRFGIFETGKVTFDQNEIDQLYVKPVEPVKSSFNPSTPKRTNTFAPRQGTWLKDD